MIDLLSGWAAIITVICLTLIGMHIYYKNVYSYWNKKGVRGPKPWPIVGTLATVLLGNRMQLEKEWAKTYGKVYGVYAGTTPRLVIADPEVLVQICIKDFDAFPNHEVHEFSNIYRKHFLIFLKGDHWKKVRAFLSPTFTSGKIKRMFKLLDACADDLVKCFSEQLPPKNGNTTRASVVNLKDMYNLFTMDAITTCCYGLKLERAGSANLKTAATRNNFVQIAMKLFEFNLWRIMALTCGPKPILRLIGFKSTSPANVAPMASTVKSLLDGRRKSHKKLDDYLQLLIEAKLDDKMDLDEMDLKENHHAGLTHQSILDDQKKMVDEIKLKAGGTGKDIVLSEIEALSNAMFLLIVGLETTGTLLTNCSYSLAFHQDIQQKLYDELLKIAEYNEDKSCVSFTYDALTSCQYLDAVISEALRILAPVIMLDREADRDYHIEKYNIDLPKGSKLNLAYYAVLNSPDYWEEPDKFNPERFMPGNREKIVPGSYCPFGIGPRHCLGMRFSLTEAKLALAKIMMNFRFEPAPNTAFPPVPKRTFALNNIKTPNVLLIPRED